MLEFIAHRPSCDVSTCNANREFVLKMSPEHENVNFYPHCCNQISLPHDGQNPPFLGVLHVCPRERF